MNATPPSPPPTSTGRRNNPTNLSQENAMTNPSPIQNPISPSAKRKAMNRFGLRLLSTDIPLLRFVCRFPLSTPEEIAARTRIDDNSDKPRNVVQLRKRMNQFEAVGLAKRTEQPQERKISYHYKHVCPNCNNVDEIIGH